MKEINSIFGLVIPSLDNINSNFDIIISKEMLYFLSYVKFMLFCNIVSMEEKISVIRPISEGLNSLLYFLNK